MVNCSIPNSILANGRTPTGSSRRSRKRENQRTASVLVIPGWESSLQKRRQVRRGESVLWRTAALQNALNARKIWPWTLDVGRCVFSIIWRVKGAWWPSRSSKPPSFRLAGRDRFDSYPLRHLISDHRPERSEAESNDSEAMPTGNWPGFPDFLE
jgi:hypothetical protein